MNGFQARDAPAIRARRGCRSAPGAVRDLVLRTIDERRNLRDTCRRRDRRSGNEPARPARIAVDRRRPPRSACSAPPRCARPRARTRRAATAGSRARTPGACRRDRRRCGRCFRRAAAAASRCASPGRPRSAGSRRRRSRPTRGSGRRRCARNSSMSQGMWPVSTSTAPVTRSTRRSCSNSLSRLVMRYTPRPSGVKRAVGTLGRPVALADRRQRRGRDVHDVQVRSRSPRRSC